jgi:peptide/nickel transport system substrate-binding protein
VSTRGSSTVVLHLSAGFSPLTSLLADRAGMVMSPTQLDKGGTFASNPVCVGPFQFVSRTVGDRIVLKKSNFYYNRSKVKLSGLVFRIINEPNAMATNLRTHAIDVADRLAATTLPSLRREKSLRLIKTTTLGYQGITINIGNKNGLTQPYENVGTPLARHASLRQALALALDGKEINRVVFNGTVLPDCSPISPVLKAWRDPKFRCPAHNLAKAKRLVRASGVQTPIKVNLMIGNDTQAARLGRVIQAEAGKAGFAINLQPTEFVTSLRLADAGNFDTFAVGFSGRVDPDGTVYGFVHKGGSLNDSGYSNKKVDKLLDHARFFTSLKARKHLYDLAFKILQKDLPLIYVWHPNNFTGVVSGVKGVKVFGDGLIRPEFATK